MAGRTCDHLRSVFGDCSVNGSLTSARHPSSTQGRFGTGVGVTLGLQSDSTLNIGRLNGCCLTYAVDQRFEPNEELAESRGVSSLPGRGRRRHYPRGGTRRRSGLLSAAPRRRRGHDRAYVADIGSKFCRTREGPGYIHDGLSVAMQRQLRNKAILRSRSQKAGG